MAADRLSRTLDNPAVRVSAITLLATAIACLRVGGGPMRVLWAEDGSRLRACSTPLTEGMRLLSTAPEGWPA